MIKTIFLFLVIFFLGGFLEGRSRKSQESKRFGNYFGFIAILCGLISIYLFLGNNTRIVYLSILLSFIAGGIIGYIVGRVTPGPSPIWTVITSLIGIAIFVGVGLSEEKLPPLVVLIPWGVGMIAAAILGWWMKWRPYGTTRQSKGK